MIGEWEADGSYDRPGKGKDAVHDGGGKGNEADAENYGEQQLEAHGNIVFVHYEDDAAECHCHNGNPLASRAGDGIHYPFQGAGKFRDAA